MVDTRIKISSVVKNQLPLFVKEEFPLVEEFLTQYYEGLEFQSGSLDILQNIDIYSKLDELTNLVESTTTTNSISFFDDVIPVTNTDGFPESYGLIKIDSEIITYTSKTPTSFNGCIRGFSGITSYRSNLQTDHLVFSESEVSEHSNESVVENLSVLFLKEFFKKIKYQIAPGFEDREFDSDLNERLFLKQTKDFYSSKGTDNSFKILFGALYGENVEVIKPRDYLFKPSDAQYRVTKDIVVESIEGNPLDLENRTLFQDETDFIKKAYGSVTKVEKLVRGDKEYYVLSLDYDYNKDISVSGSIFGDFSIHPKTKLTSNAIIGNNVLDVDSTVGFGTSGSLIAYLPNGTSNTITYESKSLTQFFNCSGISQDLLAGQEISDDSYAYGYVGLTTNNPVKVKVTGVLSQLNIPQTNRYYSEDSIIRIKTLGKETTNLKENNWFFNIPVKYNVKNISLLDISNYSYSITTVDNSNILIGDNVKLVSNEIDLTLTVSNIISKNTFIVNAGRILNPSILYTVEKLISKVKFKNYPELNVYTSNVQNVYVDNNNDLIVTSNSLPNYLGQDLSVTDRSITFSGSFTGEELNIGSHGFYTGDAVFYSAGSETNSLNIESGIYFVKKINNTTIKLAYSRANIHNGKFINLSGTVLNNKIELYNFYSKKIQPQKLLRKVSNPVSDSLIYSTEPGPVGILINGVEILNYKSKDAVYYGPIESIDVIAEGDGYDAINPPTLSIEDSTGSSAKGFCEVHGILDRVDVIDGGFDYVTEPIINIIGGNGFEAKAKANLLTFEYSVDLNADSSSGLVNLTNNTVGFSSYHKFRDGEKIVYETFGQKGIGGLSTNSTYYASVQDQYTIKLHKNYDDAIVGINTIDINLHGNGVHQFKCVNLKNKIGSVSVVDRGIAYKNRKTTTTAVGIDTFNSLIRIENHGYIDGEVIQYQSEGTPVGGLTNNELYYLTKVDDNSFKLSNIGVGSISKYFYFDTSQYVSLTSVGVGTHIFNHQPIVVTVSGEIGVSTRTGQKFDAVLQPIFRGPIKSVFVSDGGKNYGSEEILNYNRQPSYTLNSGSGASAVPVINDGKITEVVVLDGGSNYNAPPDLQLIVQGMGVGAILTPVVQDGVLTEVKVVYGGVGYGTDSVKIEVISPGSGANLNFQPKQWTVNLVERCIQSNQITDDDGIVDTSINSSYGLEYGHSYSPRKLRQSVTTTRLVNGVKTYIPDLIIQNNREINSTSHSPIIGWAYDGNPIYGPYGYSSETGGVIKQLSTGYGLSNLNSRPSSSIYPSGFFVEDYEYKSTGDLDEFNGRFCITPEFPNGVYAYFSTIDTNVQSSGPFKNYKRPVFPYFIGNEYKSKPIDYNYNVSSNQDEVDLIKTGWLRNTSPYNINSSNSDYRFLNYPNKIKNQNTKVRYAKSGKISSIGISSGGNNYSVNNPIIFDNTGTEGFNAAAVVSSIKGKKINSLITETTTANEVEFVPFTSNNKFIGFATSPHNLSNRDFVRISGLSTDNSGLDGNFTIGVSTNNFVLQSSIGSSVSTGIVTYFNVYGTLTYPYINVNDIFQIDSELVKVLSIDSISSRIKVLRSYNNTVGTSHSASTVLYEKTRKFTVDVGVTTSSSSYSLNKTIYFDPSESLGIGTISGVGIGNTIYFSNPGVGVTSLFVPTKSIYLKDHNLQTGVQLIYSTNGGTSVSISTDGINSTQLSEGQVVYAARISNDLIGISTQQVGLGSTGTFVGINSSVNVSTLYFTGIGSGNNHSFKTIYSNVLTGNVLKNKVVVSTATTHGLSLNDTVNIKCVSGISTTYAISYNDTNRRLVANPKTFASGNVNILNNTIRIDSHGYIDGQKVIHTSTSPSGGLENEKIYYVVVVDENNIKLSSSYYNATLSNPREINIISSSSGTLYSVNPPITIIRNQPVIFDLSDSSLSYTKNSTKIPAFDLKLYYDRNFINEFKSTLKQNSFEVVREGIVGVDSTAKLTLNLSDNITDNLYYKLAVVDIDNTPSTKKEIVDDFEVIDSNSLIVQNSSYSGTHRIVGIGTTSFTFNILNKPEKNSYLPTEAKIEYTTKSLSALGEINEFSVKNLGSNYKSLPGITSVFSTYGSNAIVYPVSEDIGNISSYEIEDIGFDYSIDSSVRPVALLPQLLKLNNLASFKEIGISSVGKNYSIAPDLVVIDGTTSKVVNDILLSYDINNNEIRIIKNTKGISNSKPRIVPINNSNGVGISSIIFDNVTKDVTVGLAVSYSSSSDYPFAVGDKVLVENTSVGVGSTSRGYNSVAYNYSLFTITSIDPNIGGANGTITYSLKDYLRSNENPGIFNATNSAGIIVPEKYFPIFNPVLQKNEFLLGETVRSQNSSGVVENWDSRNDILTISSSQNFEVGDFIIGSTSDSQSTISSIETFECDYVVSSSSIVRKGWNLESGFLNNGLQRLHDNDYYQYFSYSIKSKVEYEKWNDTVSSLNHTAGFKKFSDLIIDSKDDANTGINTEQNKGDFTGLADIISVIDVNCVNDFDLATEKTLNVTPSISKEVIFRTKILQDYIESIGNRVLKIDDISKDFNSNPRSTPFSVIDSFNLEDARSLKVITYVRDKRFTSERQILLVTLFADNSNAYINQYGRVETVADMGSFDYEVSGTEGVIKFYPVDYTVNNFDISHASYNIKDIASGIGTLDLGSTVQIKTSNLTIPSGTSSTTTIVGIASTYRASKLLVELSNANNSYCEFNEFTVLHDGTNVELLEYGRLNTGTGYGIGTFGASLSGSNLILDFTPNTSLASTITVDSVRISIASTQSTGVGTVRMNSTSLNSFYTAIGSTSSPTSNVISSYSDPHSCAYYVVCVEDTTNNEYQVSEVIVVDDGSTASITEFGEILTSNTLGTIGAGVTNGTTELYFTPIPNINTQVRVFQNSLRTVDDTNTLTLIDLNNATINSGSGNYRGTFNDIKRSFDLTHNLSPIFKKVFDGSDSNIVEVDQNTITIPNHFYVSGEEVTYVNPGYGSSQAIGISTVDTGIVGIGTTDKLPSTVYIVKVDDLKIKLASSAQNALKSTPIVYDFTSVGIGTTHTFLAKNQNSRVIVGIDNVIQSPIVSTSVTTTVVQNISSIDDVVKFAGITSIFGGDLVKVNNEIMKIRSVGFGSTNSFLVDREWMGTGLSTHASGSLVTKIYGNYNIVENTINFASPPYGAIPIGTVTNPPSERDYSGITTSSSFSGRSFLRSSIKNSSIEPYSKNYVYDDISSKFTGITTEFRLTSSGNNVGGISTSNAIVLINQIFQQPQRPGGLINIEGNYTLRESVGITSIQFTGSITSTSSDINTSNVPTGGIIVSVGSSAGFGYQPLVSAGGTAVVSGLGTISSISIGNSGSGYRSGIQTVNVGVYTGGLGIVDVHYVGVATVVNGHVTGVSITNPGTGYTTTNPPLVYFDYPLSYTNLPVVYSSSSVQGSGSNATVDIVVGQGSSVIDFEIKNLGYGYGQGEILTVSIGGTVGIPTNTSIPFNEFQIFVDKVQNDEFSAWSIGDLQVIDSLDELFDGVTRSFPIKINGQQTSIRTKFGSNISVEDTLLVFINDILQVPGDSYTFAGGSYITFLSAPKSGDKSNIIFYRGTGDVDTLNVDILETVKPGDTIRLNDDNISFKENSRIVTNVNSTDSVFTNPYLGPGISLNETYPRPLIWCRQTEDKFIEGKFVAKDRVQYEPLVQPVTNLIQSVGVGSTVFFVENVKTFFDNNKENTTNQFRSKIRIISQDLIVGASATAVVSSAGTISSIVISEGGVGYTTSPSVSISNPTNTFIPATGSIESISYSNNGTVGMTTYFSGDVDDTSWNITLPFEIDFLGSRYSNVYLGSNGYITFGGGSAQYSGILPNSPSLPGIHINPGDRRVTNIYTLSYGSNYRIRVEGYNYSSSPSSTPFKYEIIFTSGQNYIEINLVQISSNVIGGITDGRQTQYISQFRSASENSYRFYTSSFSLNQYRNNAIASASISSGIVTSITLTNPGSGYTNTNPPSVLIEQPGASGYYEDIENVSYTGDFGIISGINTVSVGVASTGIVFDLFIPTNSYLRDSSIVGSAITVSGIQTGYYFVVNRSNVGNGLTSLYQNGSVIGFGTSFIDNVYEVASVSIAQTAVPGVGITAVAKVTVSVKGYNGLSGIGYSNFYGEYSWGRIEASNRIGAKSFNVYNNALLGISTSPLIERVNPLRYLNYN